MPANLHATPTLRLTTSGGAISQVDKSYSQPEECLLGGDGDLGGAYIVRLPCGDSNDYLRCVRALQGGLGGLGQSMARCSLMPGCALLSL
jgi:hypothetical protein